MTTKELEEKLLYTPKNIGCIATDDTINEAFNFSHGYKEFLSSCKTEREATIYAINKAKNKGFTEFDYTKKYNPGDKVYYNNRNKSCIFCIIGEQSLEQGVNIIASHIDSPRIDLKPRPIYEEGEIGLFKTHYYGGLKKYQWTAIPLALHGVIIKPSGETVNICIGENDDDPVFCITDLLPHLAGEQMKRTLAEGIKGEELNVVIGATPYKSIDDDEKVSERVKLNTLRLLNEKYDITESDFLSAELSIVPAFKARDIGFDRALVGSYGQDDRVCAYTSLTATLELSTIPKRTLVTVLADKEEVGSDGNTGLNSSYMRYFIADLAKPYDIEARTVLKHSYCLSADVNTAFDPTFADVTERKNTPYINYGVVLTKYTGARGKSGSSDASAEFTAMIGRILTKSGVIWQTGELGKVDQGGGGTVAAYVANLDVDVIDIGVPVLSMHSPYEITSKMDIYMAYKAFEAFCHS